MNYAEKLLVDNREIGLGCPAYFIADLASNHDRDIERAKHLIGLAARAGADAVKFQHFLAKDIVSDQGFRSLGAQTSHQAAWSRPVYEVYESNELPRDWTEELAACAAGAGVHFLTTPYDAEAVSLTSPFVAAFKVGSGDITFAPLLEVIAAEQKPVLLATGASDDAEVVRAVELLLRINPQLCVMQCNTNYTGSLENFRFVNLRVLHRFAQRWPGMPLGLSDHTPGHATVLGAVTLGARAIEKHFTDDRGREGPDHAFSMDPEGWSDMVERVRELEASLGDGVKRVEANERETAVVQRRSLRVRHDLCAGSVVTEEDVVSLRPAPQGSIAPVDLGAVLGKTLNRDLAAGECVSEADLA